MQNIELSSNDRIFCLYCAASILEDISQPEVVFSPEFLQKAAIGVISVVASDLSPGVQEGARHLIILLQELMADSDKSIFVLLTNTLQKELAGSKVGGVTCEKYHMRNALNFLIELDYRDMHAEGESLQALHVIATTAVDKETKVLSYIAMAECIKEQPDSADVCVDIYAMAMESPDVALKTCVIYCLIQLALHLPSNSLLLFVPPCIKLLADKDLDPLLESALVTFHKILARKDVRVGAKIEPILIDIVRTKASSEGGKLRQVNAMIALADLQPITKKSYEVSKRAADKLFIADVDPNIRVLCLVVLRNLLTGSKSAPSSSAMKPLSDVSTFLCENPQLLRNLPTQPSLFYAALVTLSSESESPWYKTLASQAQVLILRGSLPNSAWVAELLGEMYEACILKEHGGCVTAPILDDILASNCVSLMLRILSDSSRYVVSDITQLERLERHLALSEDPRVKHLERADRRQLVISQLHQCRCSLLVWLYILGEASVSDCCLKLPETKTPSLPGEERVDPLGCHRSLIA